MLAWLMLLVAAAPASDDALLIRAERVIVRPGVELEGASVLVQNGRVTAVGAGLAAPEGTTELEAPVVCAGFIDPWSTLGLEADSRDDMRTTPATRSADGIETRGPDADRRAAVRGGVTTARVQAGIKSPTGGIGAVLRTDPRVDDLDEALVVGDACVAAAIGVTRGGNRVDVFDRAGEVDKLVSTIEKGERYGQSLVDYHAELAEWEQAIAEKTEELEKDFKKAKKKRDKEKEEAEEKGKEFKEEKYKEDRKPREPKHDPDDAVMARVASGELPLVVEVHRSAEIRRLLAQTERFGRLRLVLAGATEAAGHAEELAARRIPVILWPQPLGEPRPDEYASHDLALAAQLNEAGVRVLIGSGGSANPRELRLLAAMAVGAGLEREAAFGAITTMPARVFDLDGRLGAIERGAQADLLLLDGDPLDSSTRIISVVSGGRLWTE